MKLLIARHGNTFAAGETPRRVGLNTDIPLVQKGKDQALALGQYLQQLQLIPDVIFCSELQRTKQTAEGIVQVLNRDIPIIIDNIFNEIDYGVDENKTEDEVIARIGKEAIKAWDESAIVPDGWRVDPQLISKQWQQFAAKQLSLNPNHTVLVVTSNGIARFAPASLLDDITDFYQNNNIKIATGSLCQLYYCQQQWLVKFWGQRPQ